MIISGWCYFWWSIKCTAKWRQQNCHDGTISDRVRFELVSDLWFRSVGDWYNFHFPPFLLLPLKLLDNWQFAKWQKLQVFCGIFCHHLLDILTNCKLWLDVLAILVTSDGSFYGPRSDHSLPMSVPSKRHICFYQLFWVTISELPMSLNACKKAWLSAIYVNFLKKLDWQRLFNNCNNCKCTIHET